MEDELDSNESWLSIQPSITSFVTDEVLSGLMGDTPLTEAEAVEYTNENASKNVTKITTKNITKSVAESIVASTLFADSTEEAIDDGERT